MKKGYKREVRELLDARFAGVEIEAVTLHTGRWDELWGCFVPTYTLQFSGGAGELFVMENWNPLFRVVTGYTVLTVGKGHGAPVRVDGITVGRWSRLGRRMRSAIREFGKQERLVITAEVRKEQERSLHDLKELLDK